MLVGTESGVGELLEDVVHYTCIGNDPSKILITSMSCRGDGNFVSYNTKTKKAVWSTQSQGRGIKGDYSIVFQLDGKLVIYDKDGAATGLPDPDSDGRPAWSSKVVGVHLDQRIAAKNSDGSHSGYCLHLVGNLKECDGTDNVTDVLLYNIYTDGTIRNKRSGYCLYTHSTKNETPISHGACVVIDPRYIWQVRDDGTIKNTAGNACLDNRGQRLQHGNQIQVYECYN
ncbi:hypothetical protein BGZ95_001349, partial [Linnemannia exigua]